MMDTTAAAAAAAAAGQQDPQHLPRDAKLVSLLMQAMGIDDYDPKCLPQLLELMHRYVLDILSDAQLFADHSGRGGSDIDVEDIRLAIEGKLSHSFTGVPSREVMTEIAEARNAIPLPLVPERYGLRLPPERSALTGINFQIVPKRTSKPIAKSTPKQSSHMIKGASLTTATSSLSNGVGNAGASHQTVVSVPTIIPSGTAAPAPIMQQNNINYGIGGSSIGSVIESSSVGRAAAGDGDDDDYDAMDEDR